MESSTTSRRLATPRTIRNYRRTAAGSPTCRTARGTRGFGQKRHPGGAPVRVSRDGGYEPRWSADGRELYYLKALR